MGLVPFLGPDWFARLAKLLEPVVKSIRPLAMLGCSVYVFVVQRGDLDPSYGAFFSAGVTDSSGQGWSSP